ncbi:diacylglycerol/polyprenol kinase family protein [Nanoarchaeota archaeon]
MELNIREFKRQIFHLIFGAVLIILIYFDILSLEALAVIFALGYIISILSRTNEIPVISWFLRHFEREETMREFPGKGALFFVAGCLIVLILFEKNIALASIAILTVGDSISHIIGYQFGKRKHPWNQDKLIEGSIAGAVCGTFAAFLFVPFIYALAASLFAMFVEAIEVQILKRVIDDNITVPFVAGCVLYIMQLIL